MKNDNNKPIEFKILAQVKGNTSLSNRFQLKKSTPDYREICSTATLCNITYRSEKLKICLIA